MALNTQNEQIGALIIMMFLGSIIIIIQYIVAGATENKEHYNIDTGNLQHDNKGGANVVPLVENRGNNNKAVNDTRFKAEHSKFCTVPTGYLLAIKNAFEKGHKSGLVHSDNVVVDMGHHDSGAFYDTNGDGCCDTYCRKVIKGGNWSCVGPDSITTQYEDTLPRGTKCSGSYNMVAKKIFSS